MKKEIIEGIKAENEGDLTLTTALGGADRILYGWPSQENSWDDDNPILLAWGVDITEGGQSEFGLAASKTEPDADVPFHLFGISPELIAVAADALDTLWAEKLDFTTTNFRVLHIQQGSDVGPFEEDRDLFHRIKTYRFLNILEN